MHRPCHHLMAARRARGGKSTGKRFGPAGNVGRETSGDDQPDLALGTLAEIGCQPGEVAALLQAGVHGAHQHTVLQNRETQVQRREKARVWDSAGCSRRIARLHHYRELIGTQLPLS